MFMQIARRFSQMPINGDQKIVLSIDVNGCDSPKNDNFNQKCRPEKVPIWENYTT